MAKVPPPPAIANQDPTFNRWLLELTSILNASGGIDPNSIPGLATAVAQSAANTLAIAALQASGTGLSNSVFVIQAEVFTLQGQVVVLNSSVTTINASITTLNGEVATLIARNQVLNGAGVPAAGLGNNGDLYLNNTGGAGTRLYGKITGAWVAIA